MFLGGVMQFFNPRAVRLSSGNMARSRLVLSVVMAAVVGAWAVTVDHAAWADEQYFVRQGDKVIIPEGSPIRSRLTVASVNSEVSGLKLALPAIVEADPARTANILPPLSGRIMELKASLGDRVTPQQVLAVVDSPDLAQAYDDYDKAEDTFRLAEKNLKRQEAQRSIDAISDRDLDQARSDFSQAQAELIRTQARLRVIGVSVQAKGRSRLVNVRSPIEGSVTSLSISPGNMINDPTQPIMTIADLSVVWVTAMVAEKDVSLISKDQEAEVTLAAYPTVMLKGKVSFVSDVLEPDSRRIKVRIAFSNARHTLKPNMFATATLMGPQIQQLVLPTSALLMNNDRITVFVETAPWTFERRDVVADLHDGTKATIRSGLTGGERVIVKGGILLND